eukprot:8756840-Prorocentrum_lima.AAC.1
MISEIQVKDKDGPWVIAQSEEMGMSLIIKWHTGEKRWWRIPGYQKKEDIWSKVNAKCGIVPISRAPDASN